MKKIQGAYSTVEETTAKVEQLLKEGYRPDNITVVAKKENIEAIKNQTLAEVDAVTTEDQSTSVWEKVKNVFSNEEGNPLKKYGFDKEPTEKYTNAIRNDEFVVLVDDDTKQLDHDQEIHPIPGGPTGNAIAPGFGVNPIVPGVGATPGAAKDDSSDDTPADPDLPTIGDNPKDD
ncbi:general stress protein [Carnobacterium inhibens]|uniref:General stress protein 17M-like domain-containing protein n=1 Tax=Carnobacterium inhibens TaxID=147709 RepID=A0ABR7TAR2_9LACT|nr:general stress protein [Carnobacterium inhibens]MBC9824544.1 hypothetical protein [Carnobacterium inhibens]